MIESVTGAAAGGTRALATGAAFVGLGVGAPLTVAAAGGTGALVTGAAFVGLGVGAPLTVAEAGGARALVTVAIVGIKVRRGAGGDTANAMSALGLARNASMIGSSGCNIIVSKSVITGIRSIQSVSTPLGKMTIPSFVTY
jgi:hypothetical protein